MGRRRDTVENGERGCAAAARTLAEAAWFPTVLFLGILCFFAPALHAPQPHHVRVVVAGRAESARVDGELSRRDPGGYDVASVPDERQARRAVLDRDAYAGYAAHGRRSVLYVAKANGASLEQQLVGAFGNVAGAKGRLVVKEVASTGARDPLGSTATYLAIAWNIPAYILATTLLRAVRFDRRRRLLAIAVVAAVFSAVGCAVGVGLGYLRADPAVAAVAFLLATAVATATSGLAAFTRQYLPAVGMTLFIVMSIPTSGGPVPAPLLPRFYQYVHAVMPLANAVDALRGFLYFAGAGTLKPILVLCAWIALGAGLLALDLRRQRRAAAGDAVAAPPLDDPALGTPVPTALPAHGHHFGEPVPVLAGVVRDPARQPLPGATVLVLDGRGRQLVTTVTDALGRYAVAGLPEGHVGIVASARGLHPLAHREQLRPGETADVDFVLRRAERTGGGNTTA